MESKIIPKPLGNCQRWTLKVACQRKQSGIFVSDGKTDFIWTPAIGERHFYVNWVQLHWNKKQGAFEMLGVQRKSTQGCCEAKLVSVIKPSVSANWCLWKLGSYPPPENGRQGTYLPWWLYFKEMAHRTLRKTSLGCRRYISEEQRKDLQLQIFSSKCSTKREIWDL